MEERDHQSCDHCQLEVIIPYKLEGEDELTFCCAGCRNVYSLLHEQGLESYYNLKAQGDNLRPAGPAIFAEKEQSFGHFDQEHFRQDYLIASKTQGLSQIKFYLEGVHCLACLWLIESVPKILPQVFEARLDLGKSIVEFTVDEKFNLSKLGQLLSSWGYRPHPIGQQTDANKIIHDLAIKEERSMLKKIGIAAFGAGNIMIYAVSLYAGADGRMASFFGVMITLLALPVLTYSSIPFYQSALGNLRAKKISIDLPIAFALIVGGIHGVLNTFQGNPHNYFDTLTILVFLLLFSRFTVKKMGQTGLDRNLMRSFFNSGVVLKQNPHTLEFEEVATEYLNEGDIVKIKAGDILKADIKIHSGQSAINTSALTGEPLPVLVGPGDHVESGCINNSEDLIGEVTAIGRKTQWGETLYKIERGWAQKSPIVRQMDRVAQRLVIVVFMLATCLFAWFYFNGNTFEGMERALALIIITCPCALGLATPLAMTRALSQSAFQGIIVKNEEIFERLAKIKSMALDKTGTITTGKIEVLNWPTTSHQRQEIAQKLKDLIDSDDLETFEKLILKLEANSSHPVAAALKEMALRQLNKSKLESVEEASFELKERSEVFGVGAQAKIGDKIVTLGKTNHSEANQGQALHIQVDLKINDQLIWSFTLEDNLRSDSSTQIKALQSMGKDIFILSGDKQARVDQLAASIGLKKEFAKGELSPEDKQEFIRSKRFMAMVGDGANDALALSSAEVGMAVHGSAEVGLRAADIYLTTPGLKLVTQAVILGNQTMKLVRRNLAFSLSYNVVGASAACLGYVSPLWAAVFMPLSSLTVLASTLVGTSRQNHFKKENKKDDNYHFYEKVKS